jgi:hypothetical protein
MIGRRMANIIKRFARNRDDMRLANFQRVRGLDAKDQIRDNSAIVESAIASTRGACFPADAETISRRAVKRGG